MAAPAAWLEQGFALVHGEDGDGRREAVEAWKRRHVDPEWADFSLTVCAEGCPWPEVMAALQEAAPFGRRGPLRGRPRRGQPVQPGQGTAALPSRPSSRSRPRA